MTDGQNARRNFAVTEHSTSIETHDLVVVGAGFSGSVIGIKAHDLGLNVKVIDAKAVYPNHFRAEKLEQDQSECLASMDLAGLVRPASSPWIDKVHTFTGDKETVTQHRSHRGIHYQDTVNALRDALVQRGILDIQTAAGVHDGTEASEVLVNGGSNLRAKLVVVATGMSAAFRRTLNLVSSANYNLVSTTFGFDIEPASGGSFPLQAFNFRPHSFVPGLQYVTFFPVGDRTRANVFTCWEPSSEQTGKLKSDVSRELRRVFPTLDAHIGPFRISSRVESYSTRYYRCEADHLFRTVLVGDAFQSVNPANGIGLSKCVTDAQTLLNLLPGMVEDSSSHFDLDAYYKNPRKCEVDRVALQRWRRTSELATRRSLRTWLKRLRITTRAWVKRMIS